MTLEGAHLLRGEHFPRSDIVAARDVVCRALLMGCQFLALSSIEDIEQSKCRCGTPCTGGIVHAKLGTAREHSRSRSNQRAN